MADDANQEVYIMKLHSFTPVTFPPINRHDEHYIVIALALADPVEIRIFLRISPFPTESDCWFRFGPN